MDNTTAQIISTAIFMVGLIPCIALGVHIPHLLAQRQPEHMRLALEQFARQAVQQVEKQYAKNPSKKDLARASVATLFRVHHLPIPQPEAIDIAIESAVQELPKHTDPPTTNG